MINAINTFFDNLFGTHTITINASTFNLFALDLGKWISVVIILISCVSIASVGMWFIHTIIERNDERK